MNGAQYFTLVLITFPFITTQYHTSSFIEDRFGTGYKTAYLIWFNVGCLYIYLTYWIACTTDAGSPTTSSEQDQQCTRCKKDKPERTHHCSTCRRCILKMDHCCIWIGRCVGHGNQAHFLRFLFAVVSVTFVLWWTLAYQFYCWLEEYGKIADLVRAQVLPLPNMAEMFIVVINLFVVGAVLLMVGMLGMYQLGYLLYNTTTIESFELERVNNLVRRKVCTKAQFPYDLGFYRNVVQVLGANPLMWLWPFQKAKGDGVHFERINEDPWPPLAYKEHFQYSQSDYDDSESGHSGDDDVPLQRRHVRRGSEGYEVKALTIEDREELVRQQMEDEELLIYSKQ